MSFNGTGTFLINTAGQPVVASTVISATTFNLLTADLANGLTNVITKDGQTTVTANIPMSNFKITGLGAATTANDAVRLEQLTSGATNVSFGNLAYTGTLTGGTGVVNLGSGQFYKDASGNVGIGTTSPSQKLVVADSAATYIQASNTSGTPSNIFVGAAGGDNVIISRDGTTGDKSLLFYIGLAERMRLDSSGRLLVGTAAASNTNGVKITNGGAVGGGIIELMKTGSGITNGLLNYYQTTYVGGINFDNTSTSFPTSSDARLKKDIVDAPSATQKIDNIRIVSHGWKHDDAVVEFGVIAQELVSVAPNAVMQGDDGDEVVTTWSVDYSKLVPLLIKAHQEQQALIQDLTTRLTALEAI
jgi:hypothetical protein